MKYFLTIFICIFTGCSSTKPTTSNNSSIFKLGMSKNAIIEQLKVPGVSDISGVMQNTLNTNTKSKYNTPEHRMWSMWSLSKYNITLKTCFSHDGKLSRLFLWDRNKKLARRRTYHSLMRHDELSELVLYHNSRQFTTRVIKMHNRKGSTRTEVYDIISEGNLLEE